MSNIAVTCINIGETLVDRPNDKSSVKSTSLPSKGEEADSSVSMSGSPGDKDETQHSSEKGMQFTAMQGSLTKDSSFVGTPLASTKNDDDSPQSSDLVMQDITTSLSSDEAVPRMKQPRPTSPPYPSKTMNIKDTLPPRHVSTSPQKASKVTQTDQVSVHLPRPVTDLMRPNLSVSDTASSSNSATREGPKSSRQLHSMTDGPISSKPPIPPIQKGKSINPGVLYNVH